MQGKRWDVIMGNHDFRGNISAQFDSVAQLKDARWHAALFEIANYTSADDSVTVWAVHIDTNVLISDYLYCPGTHTYDFQVSAPRLQPRALACVRARARSDAGRHLAL